MIRLLRKTSLVLSLFLLPTAWAQKCRVEYGQLDIPSVEAGSEEDFYYCFGLQHGKDRAFEMEYLRRLGQGRNAEILGFSHLKGDLMMRLLNLPRKASELWTRIPTKEKAWLQNYARGVTEGFKMGKHSREILDLEIVLDEWTPVDTLTVLLTQSFDQTRSTFIQDYLEEKHREEWGERAQELFDPEGLPWDLPVLKEGEYKKKGERLHKSSSLLPMKPKLWASFPQLFGKDSGSNNWAIAASRSATGKAILANDPHLDMKTPMFWYWIRIKGPQGQLLGASLPGVPVVASGNNGKVAWGLTNSYINTADAVYLSDARDEDFESFRPLVWVKFGFLKLPFFFKSFERLKTAGPVLPLETERNERIVLRWTGYTLGPENVLSFFSFPSVKDVDEMDLVLRKIAVPAWNFVFADTKGDIGYRMVGRAYRQTQPLPFGIPSMTMEEFRREDFLTPEELPHVLRPKRGYVSTANNKHFPADALLDGGRAYSQSFRALRIEELLLKKPKHDVESFKSIQCDRQVVDAKFFLPKILSLIEAPNLALWDMVARDESKELPLYRRFIDLLKQDWKVDENALFRLLDELDDKQKRELKSIFLRARKDVDGRSWKQFFRQSFPHLSGDKRWSFTPEVPGVGDSHTVDRGTSEWDESKRLYHHKSGASMRTIVELTAHPKVFLTLPGLNRGYEDPGQKAPWDDWRECRYTELNL